MPKVYIIGPTVGFSKLNIEQFRKVEALAVRNGLEPLVPHDLFFDEENANYGLCFSDALQRRKDKIDECDAVLLLPGYAEDRFACIEALYAKTMRIPRYRLDQIKTITNARATI